MTEFSQGSLHHSASFTNSLGMRFVAVPIKVNSGMREVMFCIWETRVCDFEEFVNTTGHDAIKDNWKYAFPTHEGIPANGKSWKNPGFYQTKYYPVCFVSWNDAQAFCKWLTEKERRDGKISERQSYRLPTDHEWSCASGMGIWETSTETPRSKDGVYIEHYEAEGCSEIWKGKEGNFGGIEYSRKYEPTTELNHNFVDPYVETAPVGSFKANLYAIYDMRGNVSEFCQDYYDPTSKELDVRYTRTVRGEAWWSEPRFLSSRGSMDQNSRSVSLGFRIVLADTRMTYKRPHKW
jgi:formylglycine-generating enzyme required for sulfatase activity